MRKIGSIASIERDTPIQKIILPFRWFAHFGAAGGIILFFCSIIALFWANSSLSESYLSFKELKLTFAIGEFSLSKGLILWINDALMAIFFFVVGLEIKREFLVGELSDFKKASFPIFAAVGGMAVPAGIYYSFNMDGVGARGWGIPMATDIAFALGFLALLGNRVPLALKVFLTALAIVDDIGAVVVIGIFYTEAVYFLPLIFSMFILIFMILGNRLGIRTPWFYLALGIILWIAFLKSGIHATVAGVLSALTIPARSLVDANQFVNEGKSLLEIFSLGITKRQETKNKYELLTTEQESVVGTLETACEFVLPPLVRLEHGILPWVTFFIMPIFALANAGVVIEGNIFNTASNTVSLGVICGLLFGKPLGILLFSFFAVKLGISKLPENSSWLQILGIGFFAGIGFTMSIFVASLAFAENPEVLIYAKIGILLGSILSAIMGLILLLLGKKVRIVHKL